MLGNEVESDPVLNIARAESEIVPVRESESTLVEPMLATISLTKNKSEVKNPAEGDKEMPNDD